jgi:hypothetical protein
MQTIEQEIGTMYDDPSLMQTPYKLHAVMVHEGDANQGHYWAYVFHAGRKVWLKFNDNTVSETTWDAMKKESTGGRMNTSAYSMVSTGSVLIVRVCMLICFRLTFVWSPNSPFFPHTTPLCTGLTQFFLEIDVCWCR